MQSVIYVITKKSRTVGGPVPPVGPPVTRRSSHPIVTPLFTVSCRCNAFTKQMKNLLCKRLATCLRLKQTRSALMILHLTKRLNVNVANHNCDANHDATSSTEAAQNETLSKLLKTVSDQLEKIRDLLETRANDEEEHRYEADKENEMKNDWMLAAAVLDRICAIAFVVVFVGVTVTFFVMCVVRF